MRSTTPRGQASQHNGVLVDSPRDDHLVAAAASPERLPRLRDARTQNKMAEDDVNFLRQRVLKLRMEEERLWRQLDLARKKKEVCISEQSHRREQDQLLSEQRQRELREQAEERVRLHEIRDAQRHALFLARSHLALQRRENCSELRSESRYLRDERNRRMREMEAQAAARHAKIQEMKQRAAAAKQERHQQIMHTSHAVREVQVQQLQHEHQQNVHTAADLLTEEAQLLLRINRIKGETQSVLSSVTPGLQASQRTTDNNTALVVFTPKRPDSVRQTPRSPAA